MYKRILVPVDNSSTSKNALAEAVALAQHTKNTVLHLIHVVDLTQFNWSTDVPLDTTVLQHALTQSGQTILEKLQADIPAGEVRVETSVVEVAGSAFATGILQIAEQWRADLIVMGTHGYHGVTHLLLGSVAEGVVRAANIPILLVRTPVVEKE